MADTTLIIDPSLIMGQTNIMYFLTDYTDKDITSLMQYFCHKFITLILIMRKHKENPRSIIVH